MKSIFIFRRDLRLEDNTALNEALSKGEVLPIFIFDPRQINNNEYFSNNAFQFMIESLKELDRELKQKGSKLNIYQGEPHSILNKLVDDFDAVFVNRDYTPFSIKRDNEIKKVIEEKSKQIFSYHDYMLNPPEDGLKSDGTPYSVFTPYYNNAKNMKVKKPKTEKGNFLIDKNSQDISEMKYDVNKNIFRQGGRKESLKIIENISKFLNYEEDRDIPSLEGTTGLSAHNKFGTVSIREEYHHFSNYSGKNHPLVRQLYWRDFFMQLAFYSPKVFGKSFNKKYDDIKWIDNEKWFDAWKEGKTGFPIVDAGMRQLNKTGYMHNRVRMIVSSFLTKDLHIDWRKGEKYFAQQLVDYDPAVNNGSWQWAASTGADAQPYFRIFNPWRQQKRFDDGCRYIKKWVPELNNLTPTEIHRLEFYKSSNIDYPEPIVNHKEESEIAKKMYKILG